MRASEPATASGDITTVASPVTVLTGSGILCGLSIFGGSAASTVIAYDNTTNSGTVLWRLEVPASNSWTHDFGAGVVFNTGLTLAVTGTAAIGNCYFKKS